MRGVANIGAPATFSGTYTIPKLKDCGLVTPALNLLIPGPGNTFSATGEAEIAQGASAVHAFTAWNPGAVAPPHIQSRPR